MENDELISIAESLEAGAFANNPHFHFNHFVHSDGTIEITGDQGALREFAAKILRLIARPYFKGVHVHFDAAAFSEDGSQPMVVVRAEGIDDK